VRLSPAEQLHEDTCEAALRFYLLAQDLDREGLPREAIAAALLATAMNSRRRDCGDDSVLPWLERAAQAAAAESGVSAGEIN
jgi:hypothetical protein